jgi:hypothetical protein
MFCLACRQLLPLYDFDFNVSLHVCRECINEREHRLLMIEQDDATNWWGLLYVASQRLARGKEALFMEDSVKRAVRTYRTNHLNQGLCILCPRQRDPQSSRLCVAHLAYYRNYMRKRLNVKKPRKQ